jgi:hypothetical protein
MSDSGIAVHNEDDQVAEPTRDNSAEEPLPSIPDGGLAEGLPVWLQQAPGRPIESDAPETVDIASLAESLELPPWLSALSERLDAGQHREEPAAVDAAESVAVVEPPVTETTEPEAADEPEAEQPPAETDAQPTHGRPLGSAVLAAQQSAAERGARSGKIQLPPVPATAPVDAEEFLRGGEITVAPEPRSRTPFIIAAVLIVVLAAAAVWYFGA